MVPGSLTLCRVYSSFLFMVIHHRAVLSFSSTFLRKDSRALSVGMSVFFRQHWVEIAPCVSLGFCSYIFLVYRMMIVFVLKCPYILYMSMLRLIALGSAT